MKSLWKRVAQSTLVVGLAASLTGSLVAQDSGPVGVVRISKPKSSVAPGGPVTPVSAMMMDQCNVTSADPNGANGASAGAAGAPGAAAGSGAWTASSAGSGDSAGVCENGRIVRKAGRGDWRYADHSNDNAWGSSLRRRAQVHSLAVEQSWGKASTHGPVCYNHDHSGQAMIDYFRCKFGYFIPTGGSGHGIPWTGHYARVYPVNPYYHDNRDSQVWAAQGYGVPISVPLAPVVGHTYEYGWGVPSSRLVPVSHPAY